jgi:diadenosine tetraphosphate (Ap4A) HIT family hydrolase
MVTRLEKDEALRLLDAERRADPRLAACTMCHLATTAHRVAESEHGVVVLDGYAATEGHLLVIAREHREGTTEIDWPFHRDLSRLVWEATRVLTEVMTPVRVYTAALGAAREDLPMSFPHHHIHVIPVYSSDEHARPAHVFSWTSGVVRYEQREAEALATRLAVAWQEWRDCGVRIREADRQARG